MKINGRGPDRLVDAGSDKLRARRAHALALKQEAEEKAQDARRQSDMYSTAARELEQKAFLAEGIANQLETKGDPEGAAEQRDALKELQKLIEQNYRKADDKGEIAVVFEREAFTQNDLAARLKTQLEKQLGPQGNLD